MPSYAILGATGNTGRALYQYLSSSPTNTLHLYARSKSKLLEQTPSLSTPPPNIQLFTGPLTDTELIASCIKDVGIVFCVLATNVNTSGCHIAQDSAHAVISALEILKSQTADKATLPRLVILSAIPVSKKFQGAVPKLVYKMLWASLGHIYRDLEAAEALYQKEKSWLKATFVYPGGISEIDDRALGHEISTEQGGAGFISYPDLARGMVDIADDKEGKYEWVDVSVLPTGKGVKVSYGRQLGQLYGNTLRGALPFFYGKH